MNTTMNAQTSSEDVSSATSLLGGATFYSDLFRNKVLEQVEYGGYHFLPVYPEEVLAIMNSEGDKQTENNLFRYDVLKEIGDVRVGTWKNIMNHPNMPHTDFSKKAYGLSVRELVLHLTYGQTFWFTHAYPKEIFERVVAELGKQSFVKRQHAYVEDEWQGRWEGKRKLVVGFVVNKKKFKNWFNRNKNRFLQKAKNV